MTTTKVDQERCEAAVYAKTRRSFDQCNNKRKHEVRVRCSDSFGGESVERTVHVCGLHKNFLERSYRKMCVARDNDDPPPGFWKRGIKLAYATIIEE